MDKNNKDLFEKAKKEVEKQNLNHNIKEEIKENYEIGIEYYKDVEEHEE